jgi:hypothetical protein
MLKEKWQFKFLSFIFFSFYNFSKVEAGPLSWLEFAILGKRIQGHVWIERGSILMNKFGLACHTVEEYSQDKRYGKCTHGAYVALFNKKSNQVLGNKCHSIYINGPYYFCTTGALTRIYNIKDHIEITRGHKCHEIKISGNKAICTLGAGQTVINIKKALNDRTPIPYDPAEDEQCNYLSWCSQNNFGNPGCESFKDGTSLVSYMEWHWKGIESCKSDKQFPHFRRCYEGGAIHDIYYYGQFLGGCHDSQFYSQDISSCTTGAWTNLFLQNIHIAECRDFSISQNTISCMKSGQVTDVYDLTDTLAKDSVNSVTYKQIQCQKLVNELKDRPDWGLKTLYKCQCHGVPELQSVHDY